MDAVSDYLNDSKDPEAIIAGNWLALAKGDVRFCKEVCKQKS